MFKNFFKYVFTFKKNVVPTSIRNSVEVARTFIGMITTVITANALKPISKRLATYSACIEMLSTMFWVIQ